MIQDEIIRMAREAGFVVTIHGESNGYTTLEIRFNPDKLGDFTAHVRTKDLTDDEVVKAYMECTGGDIITRCRAVIAADREKNNANNNT